MAELPSAEKVINTYRQVAKYYTELEKLAEKYQTGDRERCAYNSVVLTVKFLQGLNVDRSLCAALIEAHEIIERSFGGRTEKKQEMERDVVDCLALFHQRRCKVNQKDALRAVVGTDPAAQKHLLNFFKKTMSGAKPEARARFDKMNGLLEGMPPQVAMKKTLRLVANMRGKKVQNAR